MGFSTLIDILGSTIIGGILLIIVLRLNDTATEKTTNYGGELSLQQNLVTIAQIMEYDFRKMGYCKDWLKFPDPKLSIISAGKDNIKFFADIDNNGIMDTVSYYIGDFLTSTPNPRDRYFYRKLNNQPPAAINLGVTQFFLRYFDTFGDTLTAPVSDPTLINSYELNIQVETVYAYDEQYSSAFWKQIRLLARNLRNR
ncbi:MAG: hypothetical protein B6D44_13685 [Ignavibacteriales bacterium UTCHB2]|jgi:hypothetical protein|nr:MAG: hypothetical protein BWY38_00866 [Ignavibacteria bacterium ADurb.Bin266]OQY71038.1 MAG: hypothetical protein B6D44_13685 [Ignavibacteriales bacterium UTCHB2]HQI41962.1 hypothetical protein [Ignavibacteriaceae bacterium]